jgi:hypothetical protein
MYRSQGAMGEYFAAQAGMGEYLQAAAGMQGLGEGEQFGRPMSAQAGTGGGIFGLGEFFVPRGVNGLGTIEGSAATPWIWAIGAGVVIGTLAVTFSKNSKLGAAGIGAAAGVAAVVASRAVYG